MIHEQNWYLCMQKPWLSVLWRSRKALTLEGPLSSLATVVTQPSSGREPCASEANGSPVETVGRTSLHQKGSRHFWEVNMYGLPWLPYMAGVSRATSFGAVTLLLAMLFASNPYCKIFKHQNIAGCLASLAKPRQRSQSVRQSRPPASVFAVHSEERMRLNRLVQLVHPRSWTSLQNSTNKIK